jgi:hypothetical protein
MKKTGVALKSVSWDLSPMAIFRLKTVERVVKSPVFERADGRMAATHHIAERFVVILLVVISTWWVALVLKVQAALAG